MQCAKTFANRHNLNRHTRSAHKKFKQIECRLFGQVVDHQEQMQRHMESVHGDALRGDIDRPVADLRAVIADHVQQLPVTDDQDLNAVLRKNWSFIKTKLKTVIVVDMLNV